MNKFYFIALFALGFVVSLPAQQLVSDTLLGSRTKVELTSQFNLPFFQFDVKYYRITYTTKNVQGVLDTVSGLVVIPNDTTKIFPRLVYQHGFANLKLDVPSFNVSQIGGEGSIGLLFGGLGYVSLLPDYLGMGTAKGFHPAFHAASEASTALDMLRAFKQFITKYKGIRVNNQLFVTGYSEGGHAAMALQRSIETGLTNEFVVTAAAHSSGPYSMGEVMRSWTITDSVNTNVAWLPLTVLSYQSAYGNIYNQLTDVFKAAYAIPISQYYAGTIDARQMGIQLAALLMNNEGSLRPYRMFQPAFQQAILTNPNHPYNVALKLNDTYTWKAKAPTRLYYCKADEVIPYTNAIFAKDTMTALLATDLMTSDVNTNASHLDCVTNALTNTVFFFIVYQQVTNFVLATNNPTVESLEMYPNPATQSVILRNLTNSGKFSITDINGRVRLEEKVFGTEHVVDLSSLENGIFFVRYVTEGKVMQGKLIHTHN